MECSEFALVWDEVLWDARLGVFNWGPNPQGELSSWLRLTRRPRLRHVVAKVHTIYIYIDLNCISWSSDDHHRSSHLEHQAAIMGHRQVAGVRTNFAPALLPMSISGSWQGGNRRITGLEGNLLMTYRKPIDFCRSNMSNIVQLYFFCPSGRFSAWEFPKESFNRFWTQESELNRIDAAEGGDGIVMVNKFQQQHDQQLRQQQQQQHRHHVHQWLLIIHQTNKPIINVTKDRINSETWFK